MAHSNFLGKMLAASILVGGILITLLILVGDGNADTPSFLNIRLGGGANPGLDFSGSRTIESPKNSDFSNDSPQNNLTSALVSDYLNKFLLKNADAADLSINGNVKLPSIDAFDKIVSEKTETGFDFKRFGIKDVRISKDDSLKNKLAYIDALDVLLRKGFGSFNKNIFDIINEFLENGSSDSINYLVSAIPNYINDLLVLETPPSFVVLHIDWLNLWQKKLEIYGAVLNIDSDPLKTVIALNEMVGVVEEDLNLKSILTKTYNELNS